MVDHEQHITAERASAGSKEHVVRYVLAISLALIVIVMLALLWM
ncbi:hypothetical protein [Sphingobium sp.]|nr:hypothetical protein [Sphingobium sp.]HUD94193.1 hypothetical protein [Sphingobium sp.]